MKSILYPTVIFYSIMLAIAVRSESIFIILSVLTISIISILYISNNQKVVNFLHNCKWF